MPPSPVSLLSAHYGGAWTARPLGASGFCATWRVDGPNEALFAKSLPLCQADVLAAEADGLEAIASTKTVNVPAVFGCWTDSAQNMAVLAMQWLDLRPAQGGAFGERLGHAVAALHIATPIEGDGRFGWRRDNMLGGTPQCNRWSTEGGLVGWAAFFGSERLGSMSKRLSLRGASSELIASIDRVIVALPTFFDDGYVPRPSLVHGDLWNGNWGSLAGGTPAIFDPAVSISDAEAELAMMELFGSPPIGFWPAYREVIELAPGYKQRRNLYQLYHLLNHELLFGGYVRQAMVTIEKLLKRI
jgi:fructosamine-3-kinase